MHDCAALISEIETLPPSCWDEVLDFVEYIKRKHQRKAADAAEMERAVEMRAAEYAADPELTAFCALDGEDFYESSEQSA